MGKEKLEKSMENICPFVDKCGKIGEGCYNDMGYFTKCETYKTHNNILDNSHKEFDPCLFGGCGGPKLV